MRILEIILFLTNGLAFCIFTIPPLRAIYWSGLTAIAPLLTAVLQVAFERPRWQMIPGYALAIIFSLIWLFRMGISGDVQIPVVVFFLIAVVSLILLATSIALPILLPVFHFPKPTGPYAIGTITYHWVDTSRPELFTADPDDHREIMAQIWYPAGNKFPAARAPYIPDADVVTPAMARIAHFPGYLFTHLKYVKTNAVASAPVADDQANYPVLLFLSGLGGFRAVSTFQIEELVSHGYVVVGLDQPGAVAMVRFPDGRMIDGWPKDDIQPLIMQSVEPQSKAPAIQGKSLPEGIIPYFARDVSISLDRLAEINADPNQILAGRLDLQRTGIFGVSLGGMTAAEACLRDSRLKACLIMDVFMPADVVKEGLQQPCMFITRDAETMRLERRRAGGWTEEDIALTLDTMRAVYMHLPGDGYYIEIPQIFHLNFTDLPYWSPITSQLGLTGPIGGRRGSEIVNAYTLAFFNRHLNGALSPLLHGPSERYPEVKYEAAGMVFRPVFDETRAPNTSPKAFENLGAPWRVA